jgi:hypothetical protein
MPNNDDEKKKIEAACERFATPKSEVEKLNETLKNLPPGLKAERDAVLGSTSVETPTVPNVKKSDATSAKERTIPPADPTKRKTR